jgi:hypothetical protein
LKDGKEERSELQKCRKRIRDDKGKERNLKGFGNVMGVSAKRCALVFQRFLFSRRSYLAPYSNPVHSNQAHESSGRHEYDKQTQRTCSEQATSSSLSFDVSLFYASNNKIRASIEPNKRLPNCPQAAPNQSERRLIIPRIRTLTGAIEKLCNDNKPGTGVVLRKQEPDWLLVCLQDDSPGAGSNFQKEMLCWASFCSFFLKHYYLAAFLEPVLASLLETQDKRSPRFLLIFPPPTSK